MFLGFVSCFLNLFDRARCFSCARSLEGGRGGGYFIWPCKGGMAGLHLGKPLSGRVSVISNQDSSVVSPPRYKISRGSLPSYKIKGPIPYISCSL